jgi:glycosyltransferase involved in cell wall biosynthesis
VLPSGSNLPDRRWARDTTRRALGIREDQPVLAAFGMTHPSRLLQHLRCAVLAAAEKNPETVVLNLGASTPSLDVGRSVRSVLTPGPLTADELARYLGAADLLLLPFSDGITTGRTTLMAGLQHGIPVLGTDGPSTSDDLRSSGAIALVQSATTPGTYARRACELLADARERGRLSRAGRALYEKRFAWPKIAAQLMAMIEEASTCDR